MRYPLGIAREYYVYLPGAWSDLRHEETRRVMESRFCVLNDTEDLQTRISNAENNILFER